VQGVSAKDDFGPRDPRDLFKARDSF